MKRQKSNRSPTQKQDKAGFNTQHTPLESIIWMPVDVAALRGRPQRPAPRHR